MKLRLPVSGLASALMILGAMHANAVTINWGSGVLDSLATTDGKALDSTYEIQLGVFIDDFVPTAENMSEWAANWRTFDQASFDAELGYFTGTAELKADGTSSSAAASVGMNFSDLEAYVWVFNDLAIEGATQWFLGRSDSWVMPTATGGCCDSRPPTQWSTGDLAPGDTPVFGGQGAAAGGGYVYSPGNHVLQAYNVVPEPSVLLLSTLGFLMLMRRRNPG